MALSRPRLCPHNVMSFLCLFSALHLPSYTVDVLLRRGHAVNELVKSRKRVTLRMPERREGEGLGEAEGLRVVWMGGRYICGSSIGGSGIDIVLSSICTLPHFFRSSFQSGECRGRRISSRQNHL